MGEKEKVFWGGEEEGGGGIGGEAVGPAAWAPRVAGMGQAEEAGETGSGAERRLCRMKRGGGGARKRAVQAAAQQRDY